MKFIIHTFLLRLIRLSGSVISPPRWTTSLCTDTSPRDTGRCGVLRYSMTADSRQQLTSPVLSGGAGRVWVQQGIRLREVRERAGAAARPGLHDRGDGARQQAHQGWSPCCGFHSTVLPDMLSSVISDDNVEVDCVSDSMPLVRRCPWLTRRTELRMAGACLPRPAG